MTEWRAVVGHEGQYEVSELGEIRGLARIDARGNRRNARALTAVVDSNGYKRVRLTRNGKGRTPTIHRLVLEAFVGPCPEGMEACHNDGCRSNSSLANLRWDTKKANWADSLAHGSRQPGIENPHAKIGAVDAERILDLKRAKVSDRKIARWLGVSNGTVWNVRRGLTRFSQLVQPRALN